MTRLCQHLPHQPNPPGADRRAHRQLTTATRGAYDEQVRHIRARDEEDERNGAHQRQNRRPDIADQILEHRHGVEIQARRLLDRKLFAQVGRDAIDERLRLRHGHARFQAADHPERDVVAIRGFEVEARGRPHVRQPFDVRARRKQHLEIRREDADDVRTAAAEIDVLIDHLRIAAVAPHP